MDGDNLSELEPLDGRLQKTPSKQNNRRKSGPKVRTGCFTCRTRRVKCDEEKPVCQKCIKYGSVCAYPRTSVKKVDKSKPLLPIAPRRRPSNVSPSLAIYQTRFSSDQEFRCFRLFQERTMFDLVGSDDSDLWSKTVLQACEHEDVFRHAVIAIGGLDRTLELSSVSGQKFPVGAVNINKSLQKHYQFALQQYDKFVVEMQRKLRGGSYALRYILISCILVVCFELFQGNSSALHHASTGLALIKRTFTEHDFEIKRNASGIEASLIRIFLRLDQISLSSPLQSLTRTFVNVQKQIPGMETKDLPPEFSTCEEARAFWRVTVRRISEVTTPTPSRTPSSVGLNSGRRSSVEQQATTIGDEVQPNSLDTGIAYLRQWFAAFQPLFKASRQDSGKPIRSKVAFLQLRHNTTLLALVGSKARSELVYDNFISLFEETLCLSRELLDDSQSNSSSRRPIFTFDTGVIASLWYVATKCRDSNKRWTAVSILRNNPRREGVWDSAMMAEFASTLIRIEEHGLNTTFIPENVRVRAEAFSFDLTEKKGWLSYSRLAEGSVCDSRRILHRVEISWSYA